MSVSILVVDDESDVAELFRQRFRREARQGIYVMHFADSGEAALERLSGDIEPALIAVLADINMPGMDGLQLLGEIKQRCPDLPVVMVSAYGDDQRRRRAQRVGRGAISEQARRFRPAERTTAPAVRRLGSGTAPPDRITAYPAACIEAGDQGKVGFGVTTLVRAGWAG